MKTTTSWNVTIQIHLEEEKNERWDQEVGSEKWRIANIKQTFDSLGDAGTVLVYGYRYKKDGILGGTFAKVPLLVEDLPDHVLLQLRVDAQVVLD